MHQFQTLERRRLFTLYTVGNAAPIQGLPTVSYDYDVAVTPTGQTVVAYYVSPGTRKRTLNVARFGADGKQIGKIASLYTPDGMDPKELHVDVEVDASGRAIVAYERTRTGQPDFLQHTDIYVARVDAAGVATASTRLSDAKNDEDFPSLAVADDGSFVVAWRWSNINDSQDVNLHVRAVGADLKPRGKASTVVRPSYGSDEGPSQGTFDVALTPNGKSAILVYDQQHSDEHVQVDAQRFNVSSSGLSTKGSSTTLHPPGSATAIYENFSPAVAVRADGSFAMAYRQAKLVGQSSVAVRPMFQRFSAAGKAVGASFDLGAGEAGADDPNAASLVQDIGTAANDYVVYRTPEVGSDGEAVLTRVDGDDGVPIAADSILQPTAGKLATGRDGELAFVGPGTGFGTAEPTRRQYFAVGGTFVADGALYAYGTDSADDIRVALSGKTLTVTTNRAAKTFDAAGISAIHIEALGGNDTVHNDTSINSTLRGGGGADKLFGGEGQDSINGGTGKDHLYGNGNNDLLDLHDGSPGDTADGGGGKNDRVRKDDGDLISLIP